MTPPVTPPVTPRDADDELGERLRRLSRKLPGSPRVEPRGVASVGAQRRTLFVDLISDDACVPAVVQIAASELAEISVEAEASLLAEVARRGVPTPPLIAWDSELRVIVTRRIAGESIPRRVLRLVASKPALGHELASQCGEALAAIHSTPTNQLQGLLDLSAAVDYVDRLEALYARIDPPIPVLRLGLNHLRRTPPSPTPHPTLIHGDFRNGNLLVSESGLAAVLDWELAHLGDPMEDLAWLCLRTWRFGEDDLEVGGFAALASLRAAYEASGGSWREDAFAWWTIARTLWWGLGLALQAQLASGGEAPSVVLAASGRRIVELEYDLLTLLE